MPEFPDNGFGCSLKKVSKSGRFPVVYEASFNTLQWIAFGINSYITMSFSTFLQHNTSISTESHQLAVETTAGKVEFLTDPPKIAFVNEIFEISVLVTVGGGTPLPEAPVNCNVTKAISLSNIAAEIFSSLASSNYNIQKSNFLQPGSKLDDKRSDAKTNVRGIAKLYIRIKESALGSSVRLVCQSGKVTTPTSPAIQVKHNVTRITIAENIHETVKKTFKRDEGEYLATEVQLKSEIKLQLHQDKNTEVDIIRSEDVKIDLITYDELQDYRASNISVISTINDLRKAQNITSVLDELWEIANIIMRSIQTIKTIKEHQKSYSNVKFTKPVIKDNIVTITGITITVDYPDDYALIYSANGIYTDIFGYETKVTVEDDIPVMKRVFDWVQLWLMVIFFVLVLFFSSKFVKGIWMLFSLIVVGFFTYMFTYKDDNTLFFRVTVFVFAGLIGLFLLRASIIYFIDTFIKK